MDKFREPRDFEKHLFQDVYIDESSQTGERFFAVGGIVITREYSARFEEAIACARGVRLPLTHPNGQPREIGWSSCKRGDFEAYKAVVDVFFDFKKQMSPSTFHSCKFHCSVVDTHVLGRSYATGEKGQRSFEREIFYHCLLIARGYYKQNLFHVYPDDRSWMTPPRDLALIMNRGIKLRGDRRDYPFRRFHPRTSHDVQAIQLSDVLLGALMYRFNGHYNDPEATADKKALSDYVLTCARALPEIKKHGAKSHNWGEYTFHIRKHPEVKKGPAKPHPDRAEYWRREPDRK